jgi:hypothetical protein
MIAHRFSIALAAVMLAACHRAERPAVDQPVPPVVPADSFQFPPSFVNSADREVVFVPPEQMEARNRIFEQYGPPTTVAAATKQALDLEREYQSDKEYLPRVEIIYRLADASSQQSREALTRLFFTEKDTDLRVQMVTALPFVDAADINLSLPILQEALKPGQPRELREAGLDTIQALNDPRTLPLLQALSNDPDEELRATARQTAEYYNEVLDLERR